MVLVSDFTNVCGSERYVVAYPYVVDDLVVCDILNYPSFDDVGIEHTLVALKW